MTLSIGMDFSGDHLGTYRRTVETFPFTEGKFRFADSSPDEDDWLVLTLPNTVPLATRVPRGRRILVLGEPSPMHTISASYANQFGILVSPYNIDGYQGNWFPSHPGLPWFYGVPFQGGSPLSFVELAELQPPAKVPELSVVVSDKAFHAGHRTRLRFLELLQSKLGPRLHLFGRGIREINDKAEAIAPYAYHLAIENTVERNYWTEKLADPFLGYAFPLYVGCPNVTDWISPDSVRRIRLDHLDDAVADVIRFLDEDPYADHLPAIRRTRESLMRNETIFRVVTRAIQKHPSDAIRLARAEELAPSKKNLVMRISRESKRLFHRVTFRKAKSLT